MSASARRRVLVLRPSPGNAATVARLAEWGVAAIPAPLFAVEPVPWTPPMTGFDALLLTSANAVRHAGDGIAALRHLPAWCVGEATAAVARNAGLVVPRTGTGGVADLIAGTRERLLWLCGEDRTPLPEAENARVTALPVYRMRDLPLPPGMFTGPCIAMLHSARAARRLAALVPDRSLVSIVAISADVATAAGDGWRSIAIAPRPEDAEMVAIAAKLCQDDPGGVHE